MAHRASQYTVPMATPISRAALLSVVLIGTGAWGATPEDAVGIAREHRSGHEAEILEELVEFLSMPCVARDVDDIHRNAEWLVGAFARRGIELEIIALPGKPPIVTGRLETPGATRTIGLYCHYDGQPVDATQWTTDDPWTPVLYSGAIPDGATPIELPGAGESVDPDARLYARASSDDKSPILCILSALDALRGSGTEIRQNFVFLFEGEEEAGSPNLRRYLAENAGILEADIWIIADGPLHQSRMPQLIYGVRGVVGMQMTVYGAERYLHSGHYGNWAPNPAMELAQLLASMKDEDGNVLVRGYYDSVEALGPEERAALDATPDIDAELMRELGLARTEGDEPITERLLLPSLNVRGFVSAGVGPLSRNIVPATASASLDLRLVRGNDPDAMVALVERHITERGWHIVRLEPTRAERLAHEKIIRVQQSSGYRAARTRMDIPIVREITGIASRAAIASTGQQPILTPSLGGSLPMFIFEEELGAPFVIVPMVNHDNNQHAPDENLRMREFFYGIEMMAAILATEE